MTTISAIFRQKADEIQSQDIDTLQNKSSDYHAKALDKIPKWANKKFQNNHKIIKAFLRAEEMNDGHTKLETMESLCSDENKDELYVENFRSNYASMKIDSSNSNGKVFEDDGTYVRLWMVF